MEQHAKHPLRDRHEQPPVQPQPASAVDGTRLTRPIDGSQYLDVIEEQAYAERRPSAEEQQPRFSYLHHEAENGREGDEPTE